MRGKNGKELTSALSQHRVQPDFAAGRRREAAINCFESDTGKVNMETGRYIGQAERGAKI